MPSSSMGWLPSFTLAKSLFSIWSRMSSEYLPVPLMRKEVGSGVRRHSMKVSHSPSGTIFWPL